MNILLDALPLNRITTGVSRYVRNLYLELEKLSGVNVNYFSGRSCDTTMPLEIEASHWIKKTAKTRSLPAPALFGLHSVGWMSYERRLRRYAKFNEFDVYHETGHIPAAIKGVPQIFTIYDLSLMKYRETHPRARVWFSDVFFNRRMKYATHIITISEFVRSEICDELHIDREEVTSIPLAPCPFFFPREKEQAGAVIESMGLPKEYILFVGTLEPRKNLSLLFKALSVCEHDIPIVLSGWKGWGDHMEFKPNRTNRFQNRIFTTGHVNEEALACLYSSALALVFPSIYEGFGLPVIEAMACGCPVICSNAASLPEVAGDAALLIDPFRKEDLAEAMDRVAGDKALREDLARKGLSRAAGFSWEETARQTLEVFRSVTGQS
jgi:glycosyltransferase involved in cell wall biosynthesis